MSQQTATRLVASILLEIFRQESQREDNVVIIDQRDALLQITPPIIIDQPCDELRQIAAPCIITRPALNQREEYNFLQDTHLKMSSVPVSMCIPTRNNVLTG